MATAQPSHHGASASIVAASSEDDIDASIEAFCHQLAFVGVTQQQALNAVVKAWPLCCPRPKRIRVGSNVHEIGDENVLKRESAYFERLFDGPLRESEELVLDLSEVPGLTRNPACFEHFLLLASTHGELPLRDLGDNHICITVDLLEISNYFEAPRLEGKCMQHLMENAANLRAQDRFAVSKLSWPHLERLLASIQKKRDVIDIAAAWCAPQSEDDLSKYLAIRCGDLSDLDVNEMLEICASTPHILSKLPQASGRFFRKLTLEVAWLSERFPTAVRSALPSIDYHHSGSYTCYSRDTGLGGWSCCHKRCKKDDPCSKGVVQGRKITLFDHRPSLLERCLQPGLEQMADQYKQYPQEHV